MLRMGFGQRDITPHLGHVLAGRPQSVPAGGVQGPLHARVLLADDGAGRVAVVSLDLMAMHAADVVTLRARLAEIGGLPPEAILVACTHTHAAPIAHIAGLAHEDAVFGFLDHLMHRVAEAMATATSNLQPVDLMASRVHAPGWAFNRRPIYAGNQVATHGFTWADGFVGMEDTADDELQILVARGRDGNVVGGLISFACHPTVMEDEPVYSSDYAGVLAGELETRRGGTFPFLLGACGDTANLDPSAMDAERYFGWDYAVAMGSALADRADEALVAGRTVWGERVGYATTKLGLRQRRPTREQVVLARWYLEEAPADIDEHAFTRQLYGYAYTFHEIPPRANQRHVRELLGMWEWQRHVGTRELVEDVEIQVVWLGEVAIVGFPAEMFTAFGRMVKQDSPCTDTFIATQTNGWYGYIPTVDAFARGGYEPTLAYVSRLVPEAGDHMTSAALQLLRQGPPPR